IGKDFLKNDVSLTIEGYYKKSDHIIGYKEGASFIGISQPGQSSEFNWEQNITTGQAWSYGLEILFRKNSGRFTGWMGYTLSWTQMQFDELNFGEKFYARYDRRHDISLVGIFRLSEDITFSGTWVYGTGNAVTLPKASYIPMPYNEDGNMLNGFWGSVSDYGDKNSFRMSAYHRLDLGIQIHKKKKKTEHTYEFGVYNLYNRQNPFFYYLTTVDSGNNKSKSVMKQVSIFPLIPSLSWSIKF
ncbi:MAG: hypothetical protein PHY85_09195, partial [Bacteroidales bacterium]|nr:hypothetical protein [Bacteroidales bacterium]